MAERMSNVAIDYRLWKGRAYVSDRDGKFFFGTRIDSGLEDEFEVSRGFYLAFFAEFGSK